MWFYNILSAVIAIIVAVAALYLLFRLFVLKQGNENFHVHYYQKNILMLLR